MLRGLCWMVAVAALAACGHAQSSREADLALGKLLVASRELGDPNFLETVVLLVHYDDEGVVGLIVNRRTKITLPRVFPELKEAQGRTDAIYAGGPVSRTSVLALVRSHSKPEGAGHVAGDIYLISTETLLEKTLRAGTESTAFHVYLGYAGWTKDQLRKEVALGAWHIFPGDTAVVFDARPDSVWPRMIEKTEGLIALNFQ